MGEETPPGELLSRPFPETCEPVLCVKNNGLGGGRGRGRGGGGVRVDLSLPAASAPGRRAEPARSAITLRRVRSGLALEGRRCQDGNPLFFQAAWPLR